MCVCVRACVRAGGRVCVRVLVCPKTCPPFCSAHDEWLIMKLCMCVGYHDANNVSHFGGDPVTQLHFLKNVFNCVRVCPKTCRVP